MADTFSTEPHGHRYDIQGAKEIKLDLEGGRHTAFMLLKCKCGEFMAFPDDNFKLALAEGTEETVKFLKRLRIRHGK